MKYLITLVFLSFVSFDAYAQEEKKSDDFDYSSLEINIIQTDSTGIGAKISLPLPGGLYIVAERKAEEIDSKDGSYERIINSARLGVHAGIGDIFSSISSKGVKLSVKNIFDVYAEVGIKGTAYENDINSFSEDDSKANVIAGIRFGNPSGWEGKFFVDFSKDAEIAIKQCASGQVCTQAIEYELDEATDQKYGTGLLFNINKRSAVSFEVSSSKLFDTSMKIGYQFNF
tara:strand:+ start:128 stop:814 length:687 start_codon:yes stop_codon:yes gene_type:complete